MSHPANRIVFEDNGAGLCWHCGETEAKHKPDEPSSATPLTIQAKMETLLRTIPLPSKSIKVYGGQVVITVRGYETAKRWVHVIGKFARVKVVESADYAKVNRFTVNRPTMVRVWRVFGTFA